MEAKIILTIIEGELMGQEFIFEDRNTSVIGRAKDCYPHIPDNDTHRIISRYHCLLDINPPDIRVRDLGSKNGTYVNGQKISKPTVTQTEEGDPLYNFPEQDLQAGDEVKLGKNIFRVYVEVIREEDETLNVGGGGFYPPTLSAHKPNMLDLANRLIQQANTGQKNLQAIRDHQIVKLLGKGRYGEVYLTVNQHTGAEVALKIMLPEVLANQRAIGRFEFDIENAKALQHQHIVKLLDYGYWYGTFFFTTEYCAGGSIIDLMAQKGGKLSIPEAVGIILPVLDGLEYAHNAEIPYVKNANGSFSQGKGLVHRNLRPSNILISHIDQQQVVKIANYGLTKSFDLAGLSGQTMSGLKVEIPDFIPRQQIINFQYAKPEVDVWAAAAIFYFMLTGCLPREFKAGEDPFLNVLQNRAVPIHQRDPAIPTQLAKLMDLALIDSPEIRFKNARDFKRSLESVI